MNLVYPNLRFRPPKGPGCYIIQKEMFKMKNRSFKHCEDGRTNMLYGSRTAFCVNLG